MRVGLFTILFSTVTFGMTVAQISHPRFLEPGARTDLPMVVANDNRKSAGEMRDDRLDVDLEIVWADWRPETPDGPGLRVTAVGESGGSPMIPAPLIRVETGTTVHVRVRNALTDSTVTVFGLQSRPASTPDSLVVEPGGTGSVVFEVGEPGTYFYRVRVGAGPPSSENPFEEDEHEQLAGALIVDPAGGSLADRVFVINIFSTAVDSAVFGQRWLEALTINGLSWPFTERQKPAVGDTLRWRVINASQRNHPMHLHGFFYDVISRGSMLKDDLYGVGDRRTVVTEFMFGQSTMAMEWVPRRPGNWLFHCHLAFHVSPEVRLPMVSEARVGGHRVHMAGLVLGIEVADGPSDLIEKGEPRHITLYAKEYPTIDSVRIHAFTLDPNVKPDSRRDAVPGPPLVLKQYQTTYVTVENSMSIPTGIHWHGLELDGWSDGVPGWSKSDGRVSPVIQPGERFTYKLALMRPGTFIYHSHLDDVHQLTGGLYGPLVVLAEGDRFDPGRDHLYSVGWRVPEALSFTDAELNGGTEQPVQHASVGETHRIRVINIAPAGRITVRMERDQQAVPLRALAKDGADLPENQQTEIEVSQILGVGETADFTFTPRETGDYVLVISYPRNGWRQKWEVTQAVAVED